VQHFNAQCRVSQTVRRAPWRRFWSSGGGARASIKTSVIFLGPRTNAVLVPKFHLCSPLNINIKFPSKVVFPHVNAEISPCATLRRLMLKLKIPIECSKILLNFSPCFTSHRYTFFTSEHLTFTSTHLYQKDEWALPGNLHTPKFMFSC
jgi:hypothetical protein